MSRHASSEPPPDRGDQSEENSSFFDREVAITVVVFLALAAGCAYGAARVSAQPWHTILAVLALLTGAYVVYLVVIILVVVLAARLLDRLLREERGWVGRHWPWGVWPAVLLVGLLWPPFALLVGYDAAELRWRAAAVYGSILLVLIVFFRRR